MGVARPQPHSHAPLGITSSGVGMYLGKNEAFHHLAAAARRHARALREWDADTNVLPLPSECASGACGFPPDSSGSPCGSAQHIGNEWDHAEARFLATVDTLGEPVP